MHSDFYQTNLFTRAYIAYYSCTLRRQHSYLHVTFMDLNESEMLLCGMEIYDCKIEKSNGFNARKFPAAVMEYY